MSNISYKILITFLQKMHFFGKKFLQKMWCVNSTKTSKIIKLPATTATVAIYNAQTVPGLVMRLLRMEDIALSEALTPRRALML